MPIRIYDVSLKLGLENKEVLAKAKMLGIAAAKVPSSSLDKISGEWLESELIKDHPEIAAKLGIPVVVSPPPPAKPQITINVAGSEIYHLVQQILSGEVKLNLNVSESETSESLHLYLGKTTGDKVADTRPKNDLVPREVDESTKKLLQAAYLESARHSTDDWINLAEYGNAVKKLEPTFQPQKFGERSLGSLLRRVTDLFELRNDELNPIVYYIRMKEGKFSVFASPSIQTQQPTSAPVKLARGKIHNLRLGFGFVMPDDGSENAFFHATDVEGCTIFDLKPGDQVEYEPGFNDKGPCARKIRRLTG